MEFINGSTLVAALPLYAGRDEPKAWIVAVKFNGRDEWATANMRTLEDDQWAWGHYFSEPGPAMADAYVRAGIPNLPHSVLLDESQRARIS